jgi:hypothetical protein
MRNYYRAFGGNIIKNKIIPQLKNAVIMYRNSETQKINIPADSGLGGS